MLILLFYFIQVAYSSSGDSSPYFQKCTEKCLLLNCTEGGTEYVENVYNQPIHLKLLLWDCESECKYECMWKTTEAFQQRNWRVPQFYGKWPFIRIFGIQEPASFIFSLMNLYVHYSRLRLFKKYVTNDSPLYWLWHWYSAVSMNAWIWSAVFHARDFPFTEIMDYICAFSMILINFYCMLRRLFLDVPRLFNILVTSFSLAFFVNHAIYLGYNKFDYSYNMKLNLLLGSVAVLLWFQWCFWNRKKQPYLWKCAAYFALLSLFTSLEIFDFPPVLWTFDSHSLWHLSTVFIGPLFYGFIIDDCKYLHSQEFEKKRLL